MSKLKLFFFIIISIAIGSIIVGLLHFLVIRKLDLNFLPSALSHILVSVAEILLLVFLAERTYRILRRR